MSTPGLRRLSLADLDETGLRVLIAHGEDLFVERKQSLPKDGLGRVVASFANSLGGWLLLGVADDGSVPGYSLTDGTDAQSHIGQILSNEVEPLPPFVAETRGLDGDDILVIRVFESMDTPHLLKRTGGVPIRTTKGTESVTDQALLLQLARRGEQALEHARARLSTDLIALELGVPDRPDIIAVGDSDPYVIVRAALVAPPPHFSSWATSSAAPDAASAAATEIARILGAALDPAGAEASSRGRGVAAGWSGGFQIPVHARVAIDAAGVVGARLLRGRGAGRATLRSIRSDYVSPLMLGVSEVLRSAGAYGRAVWRVDIMLPRQDFQLVDAPRLTGRPFFASGELASPPHDAEISALASTVVREFAREMGAPAYD